MADRVRRRELPALVLVGVCSAFGLAMGCTGGRAYLQEACSTFPKPQEDGSRCVDEIAVVMHLEAPAPPATSPPPPPPARPIEQTPVTSCPSPLAGLVTHISLRGPPRGRVSTIGHTPHARTGGDECPHMTEKVSGSS
jgi:hypothetical protein